MTKKKTRKKKPGANLPRHLRKSIYVESPGLWAGALTPDEITRQIYQQADKKFVDLMKHYNIPLQSPEKWWALSFYLASDMGLMDVTLGPRPRGRGRPRIWGAAGSIVRRRISDLADKRPDNRRLSKNSAAENPDYKASRIHPKGQAPHIKIPGQSCRRGQDARGPNTRSPAVSAVEAALVGLQAPAANASRKISKKKRRIFGRVCVCRVAIYVENQTNPNISPPRTQLCVEVNMPAGIPIQVRLQSDELDALDRRSRCPA